MIIYLDKFSSFTVVMPSSIHLGSFLCQSDAEHPPNVSFLMIVEASSSDPLRYRVNVADLFFKARRELSPGTLDAAAQERHARDPALPPRLAPSS